MMKNILILGSDWQDALLDAIYTGLLRAGYNTHIFPFKHYYRHGVPNRPYAFYDGYPENVPPESISENARNGYYDLLIVGCIAKQFEGRDYFRRVIDSAQCPVVVSNSHGDPFNYDYRSFVGEAYLCEFRLELYAEEELVYPIAIPIEKRYFAPYDAEIKKHDVFCVFGAKPPHPSYYRRLITCKVIEDSFPNSIVSMDADLDFPVYREKLSQSWIGINVRSIVFSNCHYYEIPGFGAALLSEADHIIRYKDFTDGVDVRRFQIQFDDSDPEKIILHDLVSVIRGLLNDKERLASMILSAQKNMENFTVEALCSYIMRTVEELSG